MAATSLSASFGCGSTVWNAWPPYPSFHSVRWGWSHRPRTSSNVSPRSVDLNTAPGSVPAHTTPSSPAGEPGWSCQTEASVAPVSSGKRIAPFGVSSQVSPRLSER